jgi:hypothetical protein
MKHPIAQAKNDVTVYVNLIGSQAAASIAQHPYLLGLVKELLQETKLTGPRLYFDRDMGRPVGSANVVETSDKDTILYAQALHGELYKRFVKNGKPLSTRHISVLLSRDDDGSYELLDAWVGPLRPPHPGTEDETKAGRDYWDSHAFVLDREPIKLRTLTKNCPY